MIPRVRYGKTELEVVRLAFVPAPDANQRLAKLYVLLLQPQEERIDGRDQEITTNG